MDAHAPAGRGPPPVTPGEPEPLETLSSCSVTVASDTEELSWGMDESYTLSVQTKGACIITAPTFVGAMYAMETLSQLVFSEGGSLQNHTKGHPHAYWVPDAPWDIADHPRFQFRGLMVDTSRHWLPLNALRRQVSLPLPLTLTFSLPKSFCAACIARRTGLLYSHVSESFSGVPG